MGVRNFRNCTSINHHDQCFLSLFFCSLFICFFPFAVSSSSSLLLQSRERNRGPSRTRIKLRHDRCNSGKGLTTRPDVPSGPPAALRHGRDKTAQPTSQAASPLRGTHQALLMCIVDPPTSSGRRHWESSLLRLFIHGELSRPWWIANITTPVLYSFTKIQTLRQKQHIALVANRHTWLSEA
ncbi:hypothetical protein VTI28DRAFT_4696 [Corynascus sepedonium]